MQTSPNASETLVAAANPLIELALEEDIGTGDATSLSTLEPETLLEGRIVAKAPGVIAGLAVAESVFCHVDPAISFTAHVQDGQAVVAGELVAVVTGPGQSLLAAERTALNFLQRMSGIATQTRRLVGAVGTSNATVLDTRKTLPGYRILDKYAVRMGGGTNHRMSLYDMLLIKDNHIDASGGIAPAIRRARESYPDLPIEVEVRDLAELQEALAADPPLDRILLDNMTLPEMREAVALTADRVPLEASGNVTLERVSEIAATGVDYISVGSLTHSVTALDISMKIGPTTNPDERDLVTRDSQDQAGFRGSPRHFGPPLSTGRDHRSGRFPRRLVAAFARGSPNRCGGHCLLRGTLHGRDRRDSRQARPTRPDPRRYCGLLSGRYRHARRGGGRLASVG